jgi:hypothetical protein
MGNSDIVEQILVLSLRRQAKAFFYYI